MNQDKKPRILAIVGCTGGGKTALAVELARRHGGEVISCDSMQIYKGMDIGTAKPTADEMRGVPHWMLDVADPLDGVSYSCADYVKDARRAAEDVLSRGRLPILCGGTGLYLDAFLRGGSFEETVVDTALREELYEMAERQGAPAVHDMLREIDPDLRTPASNSLVTGSSFGIAFGFPVLLLVSYAAKSDAAAITAVGLIILYLAALLLFIFKAGNKKK
jgi:tRNA dimethylallyltransferase